MINQASNTISTKPSPTENSGNRAIADIYPLSPLQQGMLFHSLLAPDNGAYVVQVSFRIQGEIVQWAFEQAWQQAIARHAVLRTAFVWDNIEQPVQVVGHQVQFSIKYLDWQDRSPALKAEQHRTLLSEQRQQGFKLTQAPLMHLTVIRTEAETHDVIWCYHHLLLDGWSVPLLLQDILSRYESLKRGQPADLPNPNPYRNYIAWIQQQSQDRAKAFWQKYLAGFENPTPLVGDRPHTDAVTYNSTYAEQQIQLSTELTTQLQQFAQQHQLTVNTIVQAAHGLLLQRYSGEADVLFGVTSAGRPPELAGSSDMIGLFINTLPMRVQSKPEESLLNYLGRVQMQQIDLRQFEYSSLIDIQRWSQVDRSVSLFESLVIFENYPIDSTFKQSLSSLRLENIQTTEQTNYPLTLYAVVDAGLTLRILYAENRFTADWIKQFLSRLLLILQAILSDPQQPIYQVSILTAAEQEFLAKFNQTKIDFPRLHCHQQFEAQVELTPEAIAIEYNPVDQPPTTLTYAQLNHHANQLAHHLLSFDLEPETPIAIYLDRSPNILIALLAILKVGASYLPLDPSYPSDRLNFMLSDSRATILISDRQTMDHVQTPVKLDDHLNLIFLEPEAFQQYSTQNPNRLIPTNHRAYILYTSGSTGLPKGVQIEHSALANFLYAMQRELGLTREDKLLAVTPLSFDIAALELFLPLATGATILLAPQAILRDGQLLAKALDQATVMQATPATWQLLLLAGWTGNSNLSILCGGEALTSTLAQALLSRGKALWNLYGPTETTIWSTVCPIHDSDVPTIYLGHAIANTQIYILDEQQNQVPVGVAGELYIGGEGVARGYYNRPELTAERFVPGRGAKIQNSKFKIQNLEVEVEGSCGCRLYRTGDLGRFTAEGNLEYLGRMDQQVKLRGFRIELGEVEDVLVRHPMVRAAVVMREGEEDGGLVAYVVLEERGENSKFKIQNSKFDGQGAIAVLREHLRAVLPFYMVPGRFVFLEQLPLTPNGKVDRRGLKGLEQPSGLGTTYVMPRSEVEKTIAAIWQQVLQVRQVGIEDNFFDLGGHSLLIVKVQSQLRSQLQVEVPLIDLFRHPTISLLSRYLSQADREQLSATSTDSGDRQSQIKAGKSRLQQRRHKISSS
jgi:surfactin family lipopeptide synthetase C